MNPGMAEPVPPASQTVEAIIAGQRCRLAPTHSIDRRSQHRRSQDRRRASHRQRATARRRGSMACARV
jgi:hypothetical protein